LSFGIASSKKADSPFAMVASVVIDTVVDGLVFARVRTDV
jgi:hypothetical protein